MSGEVEERDVLLAPGETYELTLASLGTAGYSWRHAVEGDPEVIEVSRSRAPADDGRKLAGRSTAERVTVAARAPGRVVVRLEQARSWERDVAARAILQLRIEVRDPTSGR